MPGGTFFDVAALIIRGALHLVCISASAFLVTLLSDMAVNPWLGMRTYWWTLSRTRNFYWINQDDVTYTNFAVGEPNGRQVSPERLRGVNKYILV